MVGIFAGLGLLLASLGIYEVISYPVTQRTQEIGIRMALGASQARVQFGVLANTLWLAALGIFTGVAMLAGYLPGSTSVSYQPNGGPAEQLSRAWFARVNRYAVPGIPQSVLVRNRG